MVLSQYCHNNLTQSCMVSKVIKAKDSGGIGLNRAKKAISDV